jgi:hypothetical protein
LNRATSDYVAEHIRDADRAEIQALLGPVNVREALHDSLMASCDTWAAERADGGGTLCLFGIKSIGPLLTPIASPWCIGTPVLDRLPSVLVKHSRRYFAEVRELYPLLVNFVDARNTASIRFLERVGFTIDEPSVMGAEQRPFHRFSHGVA